MGTPDAKAKARMLQRLSQMIADDTAAIDRLWARRAAVLDARLSLSMDRNGIRPTLAKLEDAGINVSTLRKEYEQIFGQD